MTEVKNFGVLPGKQHTDWVGGTIPFEERNPSGNWQAFLPPGEWQHLGLLETMACVSFSLLNVIETQEKFLTKNQVNYSDRWLALMSETTPLGNYYWKVADTVRKYGVVKEESWPTPLNPTWDSYYAKPTPAQQAKLLAEGAEWLKTHTIQYEWLTTDLADIQKHLKHAPLQLGIPGHAIEGFNETGDTSYYFDSYSPFEKSTWRGNLTDALKVTLTIKNEPMKLVNENGTYFLVGEKGKMGFADIESLNEIKKLTAQEETGSTAGIAQVAVMQKGFTIR